AAQFAEAFEGAGQHAVRFLDTDVVEGDDRSPLFIATQLAWRFAAVVAEAHLAVVIRLQMHLQASPAAGPYTRGAARVVDEAHVQLEGAVGETARRRGDEELLDVAHRRRHAIVDDAI